MKPVCSSAPLGLARIIASLLLLSLLSTLSFAAASISASEAKNHAGENATVCGQVASTHYAATSKGQPTFLNIDQPYPNQIFTILIWGSDRAKFGAPEATYRGKRVCVTGLVEMYKNAPEVTAHRPNQISLGSENQ